MNAAAPPRLVLERVTVSGKGWLEGLDVPLSEKLTSILGGKGTGKTTLLLFIAYALEVRLSPKELGSVKANLGGGRIELWVKVAHGTRYVLARSWNGRTSVYNERHEPQKIAVEGNELFAVSFYSHDQLGSIADDTAEQLALLDRLGGEPMRALAGDYEAAKKALQECEASLLAKGGEKTRFENLAAEAGEIARELAEMAPKEGPLREEAERAHAARILRDRDQQALAASGTAIDEMRGALKLLEGAARQKLGSCIDQDLLSGPNGAILRAVEARLMAAADGISAAATQASSLLDVATATLAEQKGALMLAHAAQEHEYGLVVSRQNEETATATRRLQLSARFAEVMTAPSSVQQKEKEWVTARQAHAEVAARTFALRDRRSLLRRETKEALDARLAGDVRMFVEEGAARGAYEQAITDGIRDHVTHHLKVAKKLALVPQERLAEIVAQRDVEALTLEGHVSADVAQSAIAGLERLPHLLAIQSAEVDDLAEVQLDDDGVWKRSDEFSHGERVTAVLPVVMFESDHPLLIDQPEDDLDNQYIYERVVKKGILAAKERRQMVFATHSANVAVNGLSELQLVVQKQNRRGQVTAAKTLDAALRLLEGGKEALLARLRAYGIL